MASAVEKKNNIPKGWQQVELGQYLMLEKGRLPKKLFPKKTTDDYMPYLSIKALSGEESRYAKASAGVPAEKDDLLVIADGSRSGFLFTGYKGLVSSTFLRIRTCNVKVIINPYLYYLFHHLNFTDAKFRKGGAIPHFDHKQLSSLLIFLPPLFEQKKIVHILTMVDEKIDKVDRIIAQTERLKAGLMQRLFTRGIGHTKFKKTELGVIPKEWEVEFLGDITAFIDYRGKTPQKVGEGIPLITAKNVRQGYISIEPREYIAESAYDDWMTRGMPKIGDVLFTTEAPLGYVAQIDTNSKIALAQRIITIHSDTLNLTFLKYLLMSPLMQNEIQALGTGGTVKGIKASTLKKLKILQPSADEQGKIAKILSIVDEKIIVIKNLKKELVLLKKGLMNDFLSGRVRVNN